MVARYTITTQLILLLVGLIIFSLLSTIGLTFHSQGELSASDSNNFISHPSDKDHGGGDNIISIPSKEGINLPAVTVIITAHPIPSHPSLKHLDQVMESLNLLGLPTENLPIILACDAPKRLHEKYQQFINAVRVKYPHVNITQTEKSKGICNNMKTGFAAVQTKYVLTVQHDMPFARPLELQAAVQVMERFPHRVKYIRFNQNVNTCRLAGCDNVDCSFYREQRFPIQIPQNYTNGCMALTRSVCWSDNNHLTTVNYYNSVVFPKCTGGAMEGVMDSYSNRETHNITGTYIYGSLEYPWQVEHEDGSETRPKNHKRRKGKDRGIDYDHSQYTQKSPLISGECEQGES